MLADGKASGLSERDHKTLLREIAPEAELRKVMNVSGFVPSVTPAYRIRHFGIDGKPKKHTRYKLLNYHEGRNGKHQRYAQERGTGCSAHFSPLYRDQAKAWIDKSIIKVLTEGEKKGDCLAKHGIPNAAFSGVNNFVDKETGELIPEIAKLDLDGHNLVIVFDSDAESNILVMNGRNELARRVKKKGANVFWTPLPPGPNGEKVGVDDFLVQHGKKAFKELPTYELTDEDIANDDHRHLTDTGNANRLVAQLDGRAMCVPELGTWYFYDGLCWRPDKTGRIIQEAKAAAREIYKEASKENDDERRKKIVAHAARTESERALNAMISLSRSDPRIAVTQDRLDCDPWLFCTKNAVIDLRTGKPIPASPDQFITQQANVTYDPAAKAPHWDKFLKKVLPDAKLRACIQRAIGYTLTGTTGEQALFFLHGPGQNGKSALIETLSHFLGDYAASAPSSMLMKTRNESIPNDVARLRGRRLAALSELDVGDRFNEANLKLYTGGDSITARFLHKEWFEFFAMFKIWMHGNHKPHIRGQDWGIWRRMVLVPFEYEIPNSERVLDFAKNYLYPEASGILNYALQGCLEWQEKGLALPPIIKSQTAMYREDSDILGDFIAECCDVNPKYETTSNELYRTYTSFSDDRNERALAARTFGLYMGERFERLGTTRPVRYAGIKPKSKRAKRKSKRVRPVEGAGKFS